MNFICRITPRVLLVLLLVFLAAPLSSRAQTQGQIKSAQQNYSVLAPLPCISSAPNPDVSGDKGVTCPGQELSNQPQVTFRTYVQYMFNLLIAVAAVAAVFMIVWGGIEYMTTTSFTTKKASLDKVTHALYGLVLVLASYLILRTIDPRFVAIPSSLVPQLALKSTTSSPLDLLVGLQNQANQYIVTSQELGVAIQQAKATVAEKQKELDVVNKQLNAIYSGEKSATQDEIDQLTAQRQTLTNDIAAAQTSVTVSEAQSTMNGLVGSALSAAQNPQYPAQDVIKQINSDLLNSARYRDLYTSQLQKAGQYDITAVNNAANYAESRLNLLIADEMTNSIQKSYTGSYNGSYEFSVQSPDGSGTKTFSNREAAKAYVQTQIDKGSVDVNSITDQKLQADLQTQIQNSKALLTNK